MGCEPHAAASASKNCVKRSYQSTKRGKVTLHSEREPRCGAKAPKLECTHLTTHWAVCLLQGLLGFWYLAKSWLTTGGSKDLCEVLPVEVCCATHV
jgi:hypothetical protein